MNILKEIINRAVQFLEIQSLEKSLFYFFAEYEQRNYLRLLKKGIPARRILELINKRENVGEIAILASELTAMPRNERRGMHKLLIYTNMVDEALDSFIRFINSLKFRLFLMNMLLAMTYSVFPWLSSFKNILSISATNTSFSMILPDFLTVFTYALMLELNSFFMTAVFFEIKSAKKYLLISVSIYLAMQLLLYLVIGKNLVGFYTF